MSDVLLWTWVHGTLEVDFHDSLDRAVSAAAWALDENQGTAGCIEVDGRVIDGRELTVMIRKYQAALDDRSQARPKPTHLLEIRSPRFEGGDPRWAVYSGFDSQEAAWGYADLHAKDLGAERVRVRENP